MIAAAHPVSMPRAANIWLVVMAIALTGLTLATPTLHRGTSGWALIATFALGGLGAYAASRLGDRSDQRSALIIILAGAVAMRLALPFVEPYLSSDIYRYIWDGRVQAAGINPYRYVPNAPELAQLRDAAIFPLINRANYAPTIYPPAAQAIFLALTRLGESVLVMKLGLLALEAAAVAAIIALLQRQRAPLTRVAAYAWHPLPVWEIAGNGHVDAAMIALLLAGLLLFVQGRTILAGVAATLGALIKPAALLALPVFWRPWDWRLPLAVAVTIVLAYLPFLSVGACVLGFLPAYLQEEGFASGASSGFKLLWLAEQIAGPLPRGGTLYIGLAALVLIGLALAVGFRSDRSEEASMRSLVWLLTAFLVLSSPHYPWYFLALVPFLALAPSVTAWVLTLGGVLFYDVLSNDVLPS
ncbi:MAG TPA: glycosyltransferase 87 family protein, partial [Ktedonobacterales bacterium]|nr:glycosyltransferase 87 family protein [Ktedonobacterales bacterium]